MKLKELFSAVEPELLSDTLSEYEFTEAELAHIPTIEIPADTGRDIEDVEEYLVALDGYKRHINICDIVSMTAVANDPDTDLCGAKYDPLCCAMVFKSSVMLKDGTARTFYSLFPGITTNIPDAEFSEEEFELYKQNPDDPRLPRD